MARPLPTVTIMIPTYGQDRLILRAVDSALAQDYPNLEVVVSDDASPDGTTEVMAGKSDARLRYHRNATNIGRVANYRHCLYNLARGEWVVNLDGDDFYIDSAFIRAAMECALAHERVVMVSGSRLIRAAGRDKLERNIGPGVVPGSQVVQNFGDPAYQLPHLSTLYRRDAACACDFYRLNVLSADWESLLRLAIRGDVAYMDRTVGVWNHHGANATSSPSIEDRIRNLEVWKSVLAAMSEAGLSAEVIATAQDRFYSTVARWELPALARAAKLRDFIAYTRALAEHVGWSRAMAFSLDAKHPVRFGLGAMKALRRSLAPA